MVLTDFLSVRDKSHNPDYPIAFRKVFPLVLQQKDDVKEKDTLFLSRQGKIMSTFSLEQILMHSQAPSNHGSRRKVDRRDFQCL